MQSNASNTEVVASYASFVQGQYYSVAARALFLFDYFVTLDREVELVWGQKLAVASVLFILNRYVNLLITILELIEQAPFQTPQSCPSVVRVLQSLLVLATFILAVFVTLRIYATWSRDWRPAMPILVLSLITPAANLYLDIKGTPIPAPRPSVGCAIQTNLDPVLYSNIVIAERATTTAYNFLILLFTFMKTRGIRKVALSLDFKPSLMVLLLRDGTVYFLLLLIMNVAQIIVAAKVPGNNFIAFFISPLTSILITRFLLNLRQIAQLNQRPYSDTVGSGIISTSFPSIHLSAEILGNMGAPLRSGFDADETEVSHEDKKLMFVDEPFLVGLSSVSEVRHDEIELKEVS